MAPNSATKTSDQQKPNKRELEHEGIIKLLSLEKQEQYQPLPHNKKRTVVGVSPPNNRKAILRLTCHFYGHLRQRRRAGFANKNASGEKLTGRVGWHANKLQIIIIQCQTRCRLIAIPYKCWISRLPPYKDMKQRGDSYCELSIGGSVQSVGISLILSVPILNIRWKLANISIPACCSLLRSPVKPISLSKNKTSQL